MTPFKTIKILIAAMGGEGGGVLTNWLVNVARSQGYVVQSTSIPGVAQRTGATTYYIELSQNKDAAFCLSPMAGDVDIFASSEFLETSRAILNGYVTPDKTFLIASTHRVFTLEEKMQSGIAVFEHEKLQEAARAASRASLLFDMEQEGFSINSVMLGAIATQLPFPSQAYSDAISASGLNVKMNIKGFWVGYNAQSQLETQKLRENNIIKLGIARLTHYQNAAYAQDYIEQIKNLRLTIKDEAFIEEVARLLALRMSFEDIARVAQLKTSKERFTTVEQEIKAGAKPHVIIDYLKPGVEELAGFLPPRLGKKLLAFLAHKNTHIAFNIKSNSISGFLMLKLLAKTKHLRPFGLRAFEERTQRQAWLKIINESYALSPQIAFEVVQLANLIKGYGNTYKRGLAHYNAIIDAIVTPFLRGEMPLILASDALLSAKNAAQKDPEGDLLGQTLTQILMMKEKT